MSDDDNGSEAVRRPAVHLTSASMIFTTSDAIADARLVQGGGDAQDPSWIGRSGTLIGHGSARSAVLMVAATFRLRLWAVMCGFRTSGRDRFPGADQAVVSG